MAQRFDGKSAANFVKLEESHADFKAHVKTAPYSELLKIIHTTSDPWKIEILASHKDPSVRSEAVMSKYIAPEVLKERLWSGDVSVMYSGAKNPLIFEKHEYFKNTINMLLRHDWWQLQYALTQNPAITSEYLGGLTQPYGNSLNYIDIRLAALRHLNTPAEVKLNYVDAGKSVLSSIEAHLLHNAAIEGLKRHIAIGPRD